MEEEERSVAIEVSTAVTQIVDHTTVDQAQDVIRDPDSAVVC